MIAARASNATCGSIDLWMRNQQGDDPCTIVSALFGKCDSTGAYNIPPISPGLFYPAPSKQQANACQCNTVAYSLMSACALCQNGAYQSFANWTTNCPSQLVEYQGFPNQSTFNLDVPTYAFLPLTSNQEFSAANAEAVAIGSSSAPTPTSSSRTSASTITFVPSTASTTTPTPTSSLSASSSSSIGTNLEIVIAIVVTLTLLLCLTGFYLFYKYRKSNSHTYKQIIPPNGPTRSISSKNPDTQHEAKTPENGFVLLRTKIISYFRWPGNTGQVGRYGKVQLSKAGMENIPRPKPMEVQTQPEQRPVPKWATLLSNLGRNPTGSVPAYDKIQLSMKSTPPSNSASQTWIPGSTYTPAPPSIPGTPYRPIPNSPRPRPTRIDTLPIIQTISRTRPQPRRSLSNTLPEASPKEVLPPPRAPEGVQNIPRPAGFKIEDTPTTTDGYPAWTRSRPSVRGNLFNPDVGASTTSLGSFTSVSAHRRPGEDSDSVLLISRRGDNFDIASVSSKARSVAPSVSKARSIAPSISKQSISETSVGDSSRSMAGSSVPPTSPTIYNGHRYPVADSVRYGVPEARGQLFPASVRAAGYTGLPHRNHQV